MNRIIAPSLMCANWQNIGEEIEKLEGAGIKMFHMDIMDGYYVQNNALSLNDVKTVRNLTQGTIDVHLMVKKPEEVLDLYIDAGVDIIYLHIDTLTHVNRIIDIIHEKNIKVGIVLNPHQSLNLLEELYHKIDIIMLMTVDPGFAGQSYINSVDNKINTAVKIKDKYNLQIAVDGAISKERIETLSKLGVDIFIVGTSFLFNKGLPYEEILDQI